MTNQPKPKGGKRPGAGRKPSTIKGVLKGLSKDTAGLILAEINAHKRFIYLAQSKDEAISLKTLIYLWDRVYGKAMERKEISGPDGAAIPVSLEIDL